MPVSHTVVTCATAPKDGNWTRIFMHSTTIKQRFRSPGSTRPWTAASAMFRWFSPMPGLNVQIVIPIYTTRRSVPIAGDATHRNPGSLTISTTYTGKAVFRCSAPITLPIVPNATNQPPCLGSNRFQRNATPAIRTTTMPPPAPTTYRPGTQQIARNVTG